MTGMTFDGYISTNYYSLSSKAKSICNGYDYYEDILNDVILKCRDKIIQSATTVNNYYYFLTKSIHNAFIDIKRKEKTRPQSELNNNLTTDEEFSKEEYLSEVDKKNQYLFEYLERYYNQKMITLFRTYYTDQVTYKELMTSTGNSFKYVKETIGTIKKDLRTNFTDFVKYKNKPEYFKPVKHYPLFEISNKGVLRNIITEEVVKSVLDEIFRNEIYQLERDNVIIFKSMEQLQSVFKPQELIIFERKTS